MRRRGAIWWLWVAGALALTAVGDWQIVRRGLPLLRSGTPWWTSALVLLAVAAWSADRERGPSASPRWTSADTAALVTVAAAAALYRLWAIGRYPPPAGFGFEEFQAGGDAYSTMRNWWAVKLEFPLTNLLPAISFRLFGLSSLALRAPFIASGIVAPIFLYLALRRAVRQPAAWAGAMLLATNRWAALATRFADEIFLPISFVALAAWLLARVLQERRFLSVFALALLSGDFFYAYSGYRALPLIGLAGALWLAIIRRRDNATGPRVWELLAIVLSVWAIALSPGVLAGLSSGSSEFLEALHRHGDAWGNQHPLGERAAMAIDRLRRGWEVFAVTGDEFPTLNIPNEPMFDPLSAGLASVAVLVALWRWRTPSRWLTLAIIGIPFVALALIPVNFNVSRYFVLLVPLFFLVGCLFDDVICWLGRPGTVLVGVLVLVVSGVNLGNLLRVIDSPIVRDGFLYGENTVLAAIHGLPRGVRAVLLTVNGNNAFEPSDYQWFVAQAHGSRPTSLSAALTVPVGDNEPVYWITQGLPEARLLPSLVALSCAGVTSRVDEAPTSDATVGVARIEKPADCHTPDPYGLRGVYRVTAKDGRVEEIRQLDAAVCTYTIPWNLSWRLQDRQIRRLDIEWDGAVLPPAPGDYLFRLEVDGASGTLSVGDREVHVTGPAEQWTSETLSVPLGRDPAPLRVQLKAEAGVALRVRLYWQPPGAAQEELVPPTQLRPRGVAEPAEREGHG